MPTRYRRPSRALLVSELPRAMGEFAAFAHAVPLLRTLPRGDGHPVIVLPGFTADDHSTAALRWFLRDRGYRALPWGLGRNLGPTDKILDGMESLLCTLEDAGERVSIIGWSLGGIFARELGRQHAPAVRSVITLGSPFQLTLADREHTNASLAYEAVSGLHSERARDLPTQPGHAPMPVPTTNIFTMADGVVPWRSCVDTCGDRCENVQVPGSHSGLGHNPLALAIIADRLAQADGAWQPYEPSACLRAVVRVGPAPAPWPHTSPLADAA